MPKTVCFYFYSLKRYGNLKKKKSCSVKKKKGLAGLSDWLEVAGLHRPGWGPFPGWVWSLARVGLGLARVGPGLARVGLGTSRLGLGTSRLGLGQSRAGLGSVPGGHYPPKPKLDRHWTDTGQTVDIHRPKLDFSRAC